jgi:sulfate adenylyltransferase subunit 1 (EFTu-like GTPase family)
MDMHMCGQSIAKLQAQLRIFEGEMKTGSLRDMDTIASDIARTKSEITSLQRNHINKFYFF